MNLKPAVDLIKKWEGLRLKAYKDSVGVPTIGYGTTKGVKMGMTITKEEAESLLMNDILGIRAPAVLKTCRVPISNNELCALISFSYNVGTMALAKSTLTKKLNSGASRASVAAEFSKWVKAGGKTLKGLVNRRKDEQALFLKPDTVSIQKLA